MNKNKGFVCIIGAGASGITAAISAGRRGYSVDLVERMPSMARKLLICGSGRCNLFNDRLDESFYNEASRPLARSIFGRFGTADIKNFFSELGLMTYSQQGRVFPVTDQASSVWQVLLLELKRLNIRPRYDFEVEAIEKNRDGFIVKAANGKSLRCDKLVLAAGGKSYPSLGANGSGFKLAQELGHSIVEPVPAAVPLVVKNSICHALQGQRIRAHVAAYVNGKLSADATGDLMFTRYGLSGTAVLDVSGAISVALHRSKSASAFLSCDLAPFLTAEQLKNELSSRIKKGIPAQDLLAGILPNKFSVALAPVLQQGSIDSLVAALKEKRFSVSGTRGWNEAEFTAGGVSTDEIDHATLESKKIKGLYLCGEVLDVDGARGGYNLAWAWASGQIAGLVQ